MAGTDTLRLPIPDGSRASAVLDALVERNREFSKWKEYLRLAVNQEYVPNDFALNDNDEVAVIPPVSGG